MVPAPILELTCRTHAVAKSSFYALKKMKLPTSQTFRTKLSLHRPIPRASSSIPLEPLLQLESIPSAAANVLCPGRKARSQRITKSSSHLFSRGVDSVCACCKKAADFSCSVQTSSPVGQTITTILTPSNTGQSSKTEPLARPVR